MDFLLFYDRLLEKSVKEQTDGSVITIWAKMDKARSFHVVFKCKAST